MPMMLTIVVPTLSQRTRKDGAPGPGAAGKWQVSRGGGTEPRWRGDGKGIFYLGPTGMLTAVPVNTEGTFSTGTPSPLFQFHGRAPISSTDVFSYDTSPKTASASW